MPADSIHNILLCLMIPEHETAQGMFSVLCGYIDETDSVESNGGLFAQVGLHLWRDGGQASSL
jgi:hypothetical protein